MLSSDPGVSSADGKARTLSARRGEDEFVLETEDDAATVIREGGSPCQRNRSQISQEAERITQDAAARSERIARQAEAEGYEQGRAGLLEVREA